MDACPFMLMETDGGRRNLLSGLVIVFYWRQQRPHPLQEHPNSNRHIMPNGVWILCSSNYIYHKIIIHRAEKIAIYKGLIESSPARLAQGTLGTKVRHIHMASSATFIRNPREAEPPRSPNSIIDPATIPTALRLTHNYKRKYKLHR